MVPMRILLVDDHVLFRKGLASLLSGRGMEIVGEAGNGQEALDRVLELEPDLVLMDVSMPVVDGLTAIKMIKKERPNSRIVMLTVSDDDNDLFQAIRSGAQGYLLKNMDPSELFEMLDGVARNEAAISRAMASRILAEFAIQTGDETPSVAAHSRLTPRETEVLQLVASGTSNRDIAVALCISENTVKNHLRNILEKLHLENRVQAVAYALRQGLIHDPESAGMGNAER